MVEHKDGWTGKVTFQDDMTKFFVGQSPWSVSDANVWRWRACVEALRAIDREDIPAETEAEPSYG